MFIQHLHLQYAAQFSERLQVVDVDDERSQHVVQVVTQSLQHLTENMYKLL